MNPPDPEPMVSLDEFIEQTGLSPTTVWRYRKKKILTRY
jgi:predicted DNA-binding transcriptional regulator AlpA